MRCPFCAAQVGTPDKRKSFGFNRRTGGYYCFRCGSKGRDDALMDEGMGGDSWWGDDAYAAADAARLLVSADVPLPDEYRPLWLPPYLTAWSYDAPRAYLEERGVGERLWREARIGAALDGQYRGRVIVPVPEQDGVQAGWVGRDYTGHSPIKYLFPSAMDREHTLFNAAALIEWGWAADGDDPLLVVEGVFDAFPYWPCAVAVFGKPSPGQVERLVACGRPIAVMLDADAQDIGWALAARLRLEGVRAGYVELPSGRDPATVPAEWAWGEALRCLDAPL